MNGRQTILRVGEMAMVGALVAGCLSGQRETAAPLSLTVRAAAAAEAARVVRVIDADTYIMQSGATTYRLRLLGADAPEQDQAFGPQATDSVARLLAPGRVVLVARAGLDLYGRTLGAVLRRLQRWPLWAALCRWIHLWWCGAGPGPPTLTARWRGGPRSKRPRNGPGWGSGNAA